MVIDKSWICLGRHEKAFFTGLTKFVEHCKPLVNSSENVKCTCKPCRNVSWVSIPELSHHITNNGWDPSYKTWTNHGEPNVLLPVIHNTTQPQMRSDMTACLNDLSYIPPNNEQNEPTQRDIGETSNEPTQAIRSEFEELYASANEELYSSCEYVTRLDFMVKFTYFKVKGKLTDCIFNEMLEFFQNVFPTTKGYKLPSSYYAIKKTFKMIGLGYESIHACVNDCFLFRGEDHKDKQFCPVCNMSRWKDSNTPGKKVPKKVLRYFSIIPRLQRLYKSSHTTKEMTWHATRKCTEPGKMQHPVDGRAWKNFDTNSEQEALEGGPIRLRWMYPFERFMNKIRQRHIDKDLGVSASSELFALACGPKRTPISVNSCVVNDVRFAVHSFDERRTTQNIDICSPGEDGEMYYEDDPDIIHVNNSSDLALTTTLNDLEILALHINGQSIDVDAPPDIIDVNEDDDIIDDGDVLPHDLAYFDDEDLVNVDDDDGMSVDVVRGDGGSDDRPLPHESVRGYRSSGTGTRKPNLGGRKTDRMHTRKKTQNLREIMREFPMHFGSWRNIPSERKAKVLGKIGLWPDIRKGINQHLGKIYTDNKSSLKRNYWVKNPDDETYDVEAIRSRRLTNIYAEDWDAHIRFWYDPKNMARYVELRDSRVPVSNPDLLRHPYCGQRILTGQGSTSVRGDGEATGVLAGRDKDVLDVLVPRCNHTSDGDELRRSNKQPQKQIDVISKAMSSDDRYSQLFIQLQSQHESGSGSGCGVGEDDESGDDEDADEDANS
nr:hypothetical protein [Tanacetum cinerariifolium]